MNYLVLGASAAGINGISAIRARDRDGQITLISEDNAVYSRCILHHYLSGAREEKALAFVKDDFITKNRVDWKKGVRAVSLDPGAKKLMLSSGSAVSYDKLLIAAGASTAFPPVPGMKDPEGKPAQGVYGLRTLEDARKIQAAAEKARTIVILGAGLIGIDAASGLLAPGRQIVLIEGRENMLPIQLDAKAAEAYQRTFTELGGKQYYGLMAKEITRNSDGAVSGITLSNSTHIDCDMLICATGVKANVDFLAGSGITVDGKGLDFNHRGETSDPQIYGAGDVSGKSPIWPLAVKEGIIAGTNMAGGSMEHTDFFASKSVMAFWGIKTLSLGIHTPPDPTYTVETEAQGNSYKKIIHKNGTIYGAIIQGDLSYTGVLTQLIADRINVSRVRKPFFTIDYSDFFMLKDNFEFTFSPVKEA